MPYFFVALLSALLLPFPLQFFAPFFALLYRRASLLKSLWVAAGCGFILDLLSTSPFGLQPLIAVCVTLILYRYRIYVIDKAIGFVSYTALIAFTWTLLARLSLFLYDLSFPLTFKGVATDLMIFPLIDGLYGYLFFSFPLTVWRLAKPLLLRGWWYKEEEEEVHAE
ncbi:hypothetical protein [Candidatus Neptunochlamydia vexilliferae]|uniref:hypothetical protein n=1 Tax=Candidatus Neptunichlamydia vexilliferae TaxID=1651774 RepID=UPI0018913907|nr:hypothetical protein [Candidatus Neptunochlamydia vexilliferae]